MASNKREPLPSNREAWQQELALVSHSGRKEGFPRTGQGGDKGAGTQIPVNKGAATQLLGSLPRNGKHFPRADDDDKVIRFGLSPISPPPAPLQAPQAWSWKCWPGPEKEAGDRRTRTPNSHEPDFARVLACLRLQGYGCRAPHPSEVESCVGQPRGTRPGAERPQASASLGGTRLRGRGRGPWSCGAGARETRLGSSSGGTPGVGEAGGAGVNVYSAPAALTQFHQKLGRGGDRSPPLWAPGRKRWPEQRRK